MVLFRYAVIASGCASCPKLKCERPGCDTHFCYHCKQQWHPNQTCDAARAERAAHLRSSSISYSHESSSQSKYIKQAFNSGISLKGTLHIPESYPPSLATSCENITERIRKKTGKFQIVFYAGSTNLCQRSTTPRGIMS